MAVQTSTALLLAAASAALIFTNVKAPAADFYSGKVLTLIASGGSGGGYDSYTRLLGQYIPKYIPGSPSVVVQNEPGGGGVKVARDLYGVRQKDGTYIGNLRSSTLLDAILGVRGIDFDPKKFEWIGNMASDTDLCSFWYTTGIHNFEDLKKNTVMVGASGKGAENWSFTNAINYVLHTKMKIIAGYQGTPDRVVAMERGELQGNCGTNASTMISGYPQLFAEKKIIPIMQSGLAPYSAFPNVPMTQSFARTKHDKDVLNAIFSQMQIAYIFAAPPGTPKDRVAILRMAFMRAMKDPGLLAQATRERLKINPMSGSEVERVVEKMSDMTPQVRADVQAAVGD